MIEEPIAKSTCRIHFRRPASARCPSCRQFYCSECITDHEGRLTCADCLNKAAAEKPQRKTRPREWLQPMPVLHCLLGLIVAWIMFYLVAQTLLSIPDAFHEGTVWK